MTDLWSFQRGFGRLTGDYLNEVTDTLQLLLSKVASIDLQVDKLNELRRNMQTIDGVPNQHMPFPAMLTAYRQLVTGRFEYAWKEVTPDPVTSAGDLVTPGTWYRPTTGDADDAMYTSTVDGDEFGLPAYNGIEAGNIGSGVSSGGVDVSNQPTYPATWYLQPIRGHGIPGGGDPGTSGVWTDARAPVVPMYMVQFSDDQGDSRLQYWFSAVNVHDGICP